jgi:hypothetical protein
VNKKREILLIVFLALLIPALTSARQGDIVKMQGVVMAVDVKQGTFVVNEKLFVWDQHTAIQTEKGIQTTLDKLKVKDWVYVEGVEDGVRNRIEAQKIYLLQKRIDQKEKHNYPFME